MRAALLETGASAMRIVDDVELEGPRHGEVRVQIAWCGVCHSDVSQVDGVHPAMTPSVLGHEAAGVVVELGPGVTSLAVGDHVVLSPSAACGTCYWCVRGEQSSCVNSAAIAMAMLPDGTTRLSRGGELVYRGMGLAAMAEYVVVSEVAAVRIDGDLPLDLACIIGCAVQTGVGAALNAGDVQAGDTVLVMGAGGIGLSVVQGARIAGATRIIVSDPVEARRETATAVGATDVVDPTEEDVVSVVQRLTGVGVDIAFDAAGSAALTETGIAATRSHGTTVIVGAAPVDDDARLNVVTAMFMEKRIVGTLLGGCHAPRDFPRLVALWQSGLLDLDAMVTNRRPFDEVNEAMDDMRAGRGVRTVLRIAP
ncbi:MAG: Zn-dependent alcohol dehydrogenase [Acidimicrobiales bacterium]